MTTELEQEFFRVFGIEPKWKDKRVKNFKTHYTKEQADYLRATTKNRNIQLCYPEITDRKLLELICIQGNIDYFMIDNSGNPISVNGLKKSVLHTLTLLSKNHKELKQQIQQLFKEGE